MLTVPITRSNARMPEMQQQHRYEDVRQPANRLQGMQVQTNADMFGAAAGRDLERAGYMTQRGAHQFAHVVDDYNTTKARDAARQMQQGFLEWQSEAQKKQGEAGMNTAADYDAWAQSRRQELTKDMSDVQRGRFEAIAGTHMAAQKHWAVGYGEQQEQTYNKAAWLAEISAGGDMLVANIHNPGLAEQAIEQIKDAAFTMGQNGGIGEKATMELMRKSVAGALIPAIHARIQAGDTGTADALMKRYGGQIGGVGMAQLGAALEQKRKSQAAEAKEAAAEARVARAVQETDYMFQQFGGDLGAGYAYIREKYAHDPKARLELEGAFSRRVGMEEAAENRKRKMELDAQKASGLDSINAQDATPASVSEVLMTSAPENLPELTRAARMRFPDADAIVVSDQKKLSEAKAEAIKGIRDWDDFRRKYQPWIAGAEMEKFEAKFKQQQDKASDASLRSSFNTMMREYNIEALAHAADMTPAGYQNSVWDRFVDESFARNFATARERRDFMGEFLRRVSLSKPGYFWGNTYPSAKEVPEFESAPLRAEGYIEVPGDARRAIAAQLEAAGREATEGNILKVWQYNQTRNKAAKQ